MLIYPKTKIQYPISLEREYAKVMRDYVNDSLDIAKSFIPDIVDEAMANRIDSGLRADGWISDITSKISKKIKEKLNIDKKTEKIYDRVRDSAHRTMEIPFRKVFGGSPKAGVEKSYRLLKTIWLDQNKVLQLSTVDKTIETLHYTIAENVAGSASRAAVTKELQESIKQLRSTLEKRAVLIGSDQVGKAYSQLVQYEQERQGIDSYIWVTMGDSRVRARHRERAGKRFYWNKPPEGGHPGYDYRCRCVAVPCYDTDKIPMKPLGNTYKQVSKDNEITE